ncbi:ribonuclease HII, partial [Enterococcus lactis]
ILKSVDDINSELLQKYKDDSRVGVQKLITQRVKQIEKRNHEIEKFHQRLKYEHEFWNEGINVIAGVDEVGRGPLAGPVVTCAVVLPHDFDVYEVNDSKQLSEKKRYELAEQIKAKAIDYS